MKNIEKNVLKYIQDYIDETFATNLSFLIDEENICSGVRDKKEAVKVAKYYIYDVLPSDEVIEDGLFQVWKDIGGDVDDDIETVSKIFNKVLKKYGYKKERITVNGTDYDIVVPPNLQDYIDTFVEILLSRCGLE